MFLNSSNAYAISTYRTLLKMMPTHFMHDQKLPCSYGNSQLIILFNEAHYKTLLSNAFELTYNVMKGTEYLVSL
jgi:hypothetical protein